MNFFTKSLFLKFVKFGIVGFTGLLVDFSITYLLKEKFKIHKYLANSAGFCVAATTNYFLNRYWTFHSHNPEILNEYSRFIIVSTIGLFINNGCLFLFNKRYTFYFSKLLAIIVTIFWNFFANYYFTF